MDNLPQRTLSDIASDIACGILTGTLISQRTPPALKWWMTRMLDSARELPPSDREDITLCTIALAGQEATLLRWSNDPPDVDFGGFDFSNGADLLQELYEALRRRLERSEDREPSAALLAELKIRALEAWKFYECGIGYLTSIAGIEEPLLSHGMAGKHLMGWQTDLDALTQGGPWFLLNVAGAQRTFGGDAAAWLSREEILSKELDPDALIYGRPGFLLDVAEAHLTLGGGAAAWPWIEALLSQEPDEVMLERLARMCGIDTGWEFGELAYPSLEALNGQLLRPIDGYQEVRENVSKQLTLVLESWLVERDLFSAVREHAGATLRWFRDREGNWRKRDLSDISNLLGAVDEQTAGVQPPIDLEATIWGYYWLVALRQHQRKGAEVSSLCKRFLKESEDQALKAAAINAEVWDPLEAIRHELTMIRAELNALPIPGQDPEYAGALRERLAAGWNRLSEAEQHFLTQRYKEYWTRRNYGVPLDYMLVGGLGSIMQQVLNRQFVNPVVKSGLQPATIGPPAKSVVERWRGLLERPDIGVRVTRIFGAQASEVTTEAFRSRINRAVKIRNNAAHGVEVSEQECDEMYELLLAPTQKPGSGLLAQLLALSAK